jgi:hypothetical protein
MNGSSCKVLATGFLHRDNWGDDCYEFIYKEIFKRDEFKNFSLFFICSDDLGRIKKDHLFDILLIVGGDVLQPYFMDRILPFAKQRNMPIVAFSVGLPYNDERILNELSRSCIAYVGCRFLCDRDLLYKKCKGSIVFHQPDLSLLLPEILSREGKPESELELELGQETRRTTAIHRVGICLAQSVYDKDRPENYHAIVNTLAQFLDQVCEGKEEEGTFTELIFIPFNTFINREENDTVINRNVYKKMKRKQHGTFITEKLSEKDLLHLFSTLDIVICMRFHAHMMASIAGKPFLSLVISGKVNKFLQERNITDDLYAERKNGSFAIEDLQKAWMNVLLMKDHELFKTSKKTGSLLKDTCCRLLHILDTVRIAEENRKKKKKKISISLFLKRIFLYSKRER